MKKKSGKWLLLQDQRAINATMEDMGALQPGLPSPVAIPVNYNILVIDLQDCFFTIPSSPGDCRHFAFSLPSENLKQPYQRYQWKVLPQDVNNSPTLCQKYVDSALQEIRDLYPDLYLVHYTDDIFLAHPDCALLQEVLDKTVSALNTCGLQIAPEKIQSDPPYNYLGRVINIQTVFHQPL